MGLFALVVLHHLLAEVDRTLRKPFFAARTTLSDRKLAAAALKEYGELTRIQFVESGIATHPEDDLILAAVASAQVDYFVTGDRQLLKLRSFAGATIVTAAEVIAILDRLSTAWLRHRPNQFYRTLRYTREWDPRANGCSAPLIVMCEYATCGRNGAGRIDARG
jgi:predicted nucleic acid-binding protein